MISQRRLLKISRSSNDPECSSNSSTFLMTGIAPTWASGMAMMTLDPV
jgi:hypothetical protein